VSLVDWCLRRSVRVGWFLLGFVLVGIGVSSSWCLQIFLTIGWCLQIIIKIFFVVFSQKGFHVNLCSMFCS
jgi:hypothetical protein